jgi:iron complex outermembrane receptor protein
MIQETVLSRSLRVMFAGGLALGMHAAMAQDSANDASMQRVEITGSSIKRIAAESSLPVQSFSQKDVKKSGVTTVTDFIQQIPAMQGFSVAADSVGGGGGVTTASIHDIGAAYTLVLLNGRRVAPSNSGTTIDLNSIPLSAIEPVEVLTDGASALYGADAIAGVVNFILKKGASPWEVNAKFNSPQKSGGTSNSFSISKGFGDYEGRRLRRAADADHQKARTDQLDPL